MTALIDKGRMRDLLKAFEFRKLFVAELGWDNNNHELELVECRHAYKLTGVAHKRGVQVFECSPGPDGNLPPHDVQRRLHIKLRKLAHEHLIIFVDQQRRTQLWLWVLRESNQTRLRHLRFGAGQLGEQLIQSLLKIRFSLNEEEALTLPGVTMRLRDAFDKDKVTKKFYDLFSKQRSTFESFIKGIPDQGLTRWYVSVILNRLMFIYFIQKRGFLDGGELDYMRQGLAISKKQLGKDRFYRHFLCPLFFDGFARPAKERSPAMNQLLGHVPYLDGGLFMQHEVERLHGQDIDIADAAFEQIFEFFEKYKWHLDESSITADDEINPDVLGYIFEKYINQKQMGAYYTKEDITGYISQNTILPFILDRLKAKVAVAFQPNGQVWKLLKDNPDRYIYEAVRRGVIDCPADLAGDAQRQSWRSVPDSPGRVIPEEVLPEFVREGMADPRKRMYEKRYNLGQAPAEQDGRPFALPTETWREYVERRKRCLELRAKLIAGEVHEVNDLITYNLNIRQFAADVLQQAAGNELIQAAWEVLQGVTPDKVGGHQELGVTVLDPTVGSGAFLFAALNVLYPLYEICLDRMADMMLERSGTGKELTGALKQFSNVLKDIDGHPNREYFILKSIIVDNLYGVDIMEEACEICKLRLFLKLVAQIDDVEHIEPLPDIDFNIRAGNTLVGFANEKEVDKAMRGRIDFEDSLSRVNAAAQAVNKEFELYRWSQVRLGAGGKELKEAKNSLQTKLDRLGGELDRYLCLQYDIDPEAKNAFAKWRESHKPFHWWAEFYGIISRGGFDVIIGNPPYVEYSKVKKAYSLINYQTIACDNLFTFVWERSSHILANGRIGMIIPVSSVSTDGYLKLRELWLIGGTLHVSNYADRPGRLFDGIEHCRLSIVLHDFNNSRSGVFSTTYTKWYTESRELLTSQIAYYSQRIAAGSFILKVSSAIEYEIYNKVNSHISMISDMVSDSAQHVIYYTRKLGWFVQVLNEVPIIIDDNGAKREPSELKQLSFQKSNSAYISLCLLNSSLFYSLLGMSSDCRNLNKREVISVKFPFDECSSGKDQFEYLAILLMNNLNSNSRQMTMSFGKHGNMAVQCFYPKMSKHIIDQIDEVLAQHYGFTDEELDFIINYDIKYRLGRDAVMEDES